MWPFLYRSVEISTSENKFLPLGEIFYRFWFSGWAIFGQFLPTEHKIKQKNVFQNNSLLWSWNSHRFSLEPLPLSFFRTVTLNFSVWWVWSPFVFVRTENDEDVCLFIQNIRLVQKPFLEGRNGTDFSWSPIFRKNYFCERYCCKFSGHNFRCLIEENTTTRLFFITYIWKSCLCNFLCS